jgi:ubiquinone biosynthesis protein
MKAVVKLAEAAPEIASRTERFQQQLLHMSEHGLRFDAETADAIGKSEARHSRSGRLALWVIAIALVVIAFAVS